MSEWKSLQLNEIVDLIRNGTAIQQIQSITDYPVTRIETIADGEIDCNKVGYCQFINDSYLLKEGDILLSNINSLKHIGKVAFYNNTKNLLYHGMNLLLIRLKPEVDKKFIYNLLLMNKKWFEKMAAQAINQASINQTTILELPLKIPNSRTEQSKIAEILSTIDKAIDQTEAIIAKQQRIKNGLMQDLLTKGIDEHGNLRSEETHEFKDSELGRVPKEWDVKSLNELIERLETGVSVNSEDNPASGFEYGVLKTSSLSNCYFNPSENKRIVLKSEIVRAKCNPKKGSILVSRMNTPALVGENAYVDNDFNNLFLPDRIWQTIFKDKIEIDGFWLWKILSSQRYRSKISFLATGTSGTMKNISKNDFLALKVPYPDYSEQIRISDALQKIEKVIHKEINHLEKLKRQKTGLMQDLLTGKVSVKKLI